MTDPKTKVPSLWLEQDALGELSEAARRALQARVGADELAHQRSALQQDNQELLREYPSRTLVDAIKRRSQRARRKDRSYQWMSVAWSTATALSLAAILVVVYDDLSSGASVGVAPVASDDPTIEPTRIKGLTPHLVLYRKAGDAVERLADGAQVGAGDVLQIAYVAARARYGVVVSIDGAGVVTVHLPHAGQSAALAESGETLLGDSYRLDAAPRFERFYFVTADRPFDAAVVEAAARELARTRTTQVPLSLAPEFQQNSVAVTKVER
jgi:hypothetical protein